LITFLQTIAANCYYLFAAKPPKTTTIVSLLGIYISLGLPSFCPSSFPLWLTFSLSLSLLPLLLLLLRRCVATTAPAPPPLPCCCPRCCPYCCLHCRLRCCLAAVPAAASLPPRRCYVFCCQPLQRTPVLAILAGQHYYPLALTANL
jgi:hypothetical protein